MSTKYVTLLTNHSIVAAIKLSERNYSRFDQKNMFISTCKTKSTQCICISPFSNS